MFGRISAESPSWVCSGLASAAKNVPADLRARYSEVPWREMAGMRDKLIPDYFGTNRETVWVTVPEGISVLRPLMARV